MIVGNDVIDLDDPESRIVHPRFDDRIRAPGESGDRWALFSAKEAAFKALRQQDPLARFLPRRFVVAADGSSVSHDGLRLSLRWIHGPGFLHALVWAGGDEPRHGIGASGSCASTSARRLLCAAIAAELCIPAAELAVDRGADGAAIPGIVQGGRRLDLPVSLSHHGRFAAWAAGMASSR